MSHIQSLDFLILSDKDETIWKKATGLNESLAETYKAIAENYNVSINLCTVSYFWQFEPEDKAEYLLRSLIVPSGMSNIVIFNDGIGKLEKEKDMRRLDNRGTEYNKSDSVTYNHLAAFSFEGIAIFDDVSKIILIDDNTFNREAAVKAGAHAFDPSVEDDIRAFKQLVQEKAQLR